MTARVPFVDSHIHLWDLNHLSYPWLAPPFAADGPNGSVENIARDYSVQDYLAQAQHWDMVGAVHVEAGADPAQALEETRWVDGMAQAHGIPTAIVAFAALDAPDAGDLLDAHSAFPRVRGIRHILNWHPDPRRSYTPRDLTRDAAWQAGYRLLGARRLSFDLQCYPGQVAALAPLIERHPEIPVIVNHLAMPVLSDPDGLADWKAAIRALAALPHVSIKLSGLGFIWRDWTPARVGPLLTEALDAFGTRRCLVASDTPTDLLFAPFDRTLETFHDFATGLSLDERRDLFGGNANRIYRLCLDL